MYEATLKLTDGEVIKGWMGNDLPHKTGHTSIKMEVVGGIAYFPDAEVDGDPIMGKIVNVDDITIIAPEITKGDTGPVIDGNPMAGTYHKPTKVKAGGKLENVVNVVNTALQATRKEAIAMIVDNVGMSPAGASTYLSNAKPFLNPNHNLYKEA